MGEDRWGPLCDAPWRRREERMGEAVEEGELSERVSEEREEVDLSRTPIAGIDSDCRKLVSERRRRREGELG